MANKRFVIDFNADAATGLTVAFTSFKLLVAGTEIYPRPTITELGNGIYTFTYDPYTQTQDIVWAVTDAGLHYRAEDRIEREIYNDYITLDLNNQAATGLVMSFTAFKMASANRSLTTAELFKCTGGYLASGAAPAITEVGSGIYRSRFRNLLAEPVYFVAKDAALRYRVSGLVQPQSQFCEEQGVSLAYLIDRVRAESDYPTEDRYTATRLTGWINDAIAEFNKKTNWLTGSKTWAAGTFTFSNGECTVALASSDLFRWPLVFSLKSSATAQYPPLQRVGRQAYERCKSLQTLPAGRGIYMIVWDTPLAPTFKIYLGQNWTADTLELYFAKRFNCLAFDNDTMDIPYDYARAVIAHTLSRIYDEEDDQKKSDRELGKFERGCFEAKEETDARGDMNHDQIEDVQQDELDGTGLAEYGIYA